MAMNLRPQRKEDCCSAAAGILVGVGGVEVMTRFTGVGKTTNCIQLLLQKVVAAAKMKQHS